MISYSCSNFALGDNVKYPTFARTTAIYTGMSNFLVDFVLYHQWDRVVFLEGAEKIWRETAGTFLVS